MVRHIPHGGGSRRWSDIYHMGGRGGVGGGQTYTTWGGGE